MKYKIKKYIKNIVAIILGSPFIILVLMLACLLGLVQLIVWSAQRTLDILTGINIE